ncbi:MAG: helix-turn-helix protein [Acidobacteria bacterium]|nr:helix-turn-helix protein [Acidobacteriota bacterium]
MYGKVFRDARLALRDETGRRISQRKLAERAGVSRRYLADIEGGRANVSLEILIKVAATLGIRQLPVGKLTLSIEGEFTESVRSHVTETLRHLEATRALLASLVRDGGEASLSRRDQELVADLLKMSDAPVPERETLADAPFVGSYVTAATLPHSAAGLPLWTPELPFPRELFTATDFAYPTRGGTGQLFAAVLSTSMEPEIPRGTLVRIESRRPPAPGDLLAIHASVSGSLLGRISDPARPVLERAGASSIPIWKERCVVFGTCALAG